MEIPWRCDGENMEEERSYYGHELELEWNIAPEARTKKKQIKNEY